MTHCDKFNDDTNIIFKKNIRWNKIKPEKVTMQFKLSIVADCKVNKNFNG